MEGNIELSAEQFLVNWLREKISDFPIKNLTTDWNDGKAIGALVDSFRPGELASLFFPESESSLFKTTARLKTDF